MSRRPTIADLAAAAEVSVATVDRVLNRRLPVRAATARRVMAAAERIGYHAAPLIRQRLADVPDRTFGFLLQKRDDFYRAFAAEIASAAKAATGLRCRPVIDFMDELVPALIAARMEEIGARVEALAVVAVDHPLVNAAVARLAAAGKPVFTLLSDISAPERAGALAADQRKAGRTAAWAISHLSKAPGKVAIVLGSHRYLSQELAEMSFRSYMREHAPAFRLLEPLLNLDDPRIAHEAALHLIAAHRDLVGLYVAGGGASGVITALREEEAGGRIVTICNELTPATREALADGTLDLVLATPIATIAARAIALMARATAGENLGPEANVILPVSLHAGENI